MNKDEQRSPAEDDSAGAITDEQQLWNEFDDQDKAAAPAADDPDATPANAPDGAADAGPDVEDFPGDDAPEVAADDEDEDATPARDAKPETQETIDWQARATEAEHKWRSDQGRLAALQKKVERLEKLAGTNPAAHDEAKEARKKRLKDVADEYGDVVSPLVENYEDLESRLDAEADARRGEAQSELQDIYAAEWAVVTKEHPDGMQVVIDNREVFDAWIEDQPKLYRDIVARNSSKVVDGAGAALLLSKFKADLAAANSAPGSGSPETSRPDRRQRQLEGAASERPVSRQAATNAAPPEGASEQADWDYFERREARNAKR